MSVDVPPRSRPEPMAPRRGAETDDGVVSFRAYARGRLIESRLTPNAISLTGLILNLAAAVLVTQSTGELPCVPRGSQPTMSKRPPPHASKSAPPVWTSSTPLSPGPPGLTNIDPIRFPGRLAR